MKRLLPIALAALAACGPSDSIVAPESRFSTGPSLSILDGSREGGNQGFFWLPPMVRGPSAEGDADETLLPLLAVDICEWDGDACVPGLVWSFTAEGEGSEALRISDDGTHFIVNWHTDDYDLDLDATYRIAVRAGSQVLGHADIDVVEKLRDAAELDTAEYVAVKVGRTLPVKFLATDEALIGEPFPPIVFSSNVSGNFELYAINPDGTGLDTLTNDPARDDEPLWSPDGSMIAFTTDRFGNGADIAVLELETGTVSSVLSTPEDEWALDWAPDGQSLVIARRVGTLPHIWVVNLDGSGLLQLTSSSAADNHAVFAPDSSIYFRSDPPGFGNQDLFRIDADGSNQTLVMNWRFTLNIEWVPGAESLYVTAQEALGAAFDIYRLDLDGNVITRLTTNPAFDSTPTASPDGQRLLFASDRSGDLDLYMMDLATGAETPFVVSPGSTEVASDWRR